MSICELFVLRYQKRQDDKRTSLEGLIVELVEVGDADEDDADVLVRLRVLLLELEHTGHVHRQDVVEERVRYLFLALQPPVSTANGGPVSRDWPGSNLTNQLAVGIKILPDANDNAGMERN